jgi:nucleoid-associated protein YgaU
MQHQAHSVEHYREKLSSLFQKDMPYIILGSVVMVSLLSYATLALYKNNYNIFAPKDSLPSVLSVNEDSETVERMIREQKLNLVTPTKAVTPTSTLLGMGTLELPAQETPEPEKTITGDISAMHTDRVTYTANTYIVEEGDTLAIIAYKVYGDEGAWASIAEANGLWNPDDIYVGMELQIPR